MHPTERHSHATTWTSPGPSYIAPTGEIALVKALFHVRILAARGALSRGTGSSTASTPTRQCSRALCSNTIPVPALSRSFSAGLRLPPRYPPRSGPRNLSSGQWELQDSLSLLHGGKFEFHGIAGCSCSLRAERHVNFASALSRPRLSAIIIFRSLPSGSSYLMIYGGAITPMIPWTRNEPS